MIHGDSAEELENLKVRAKSAIMRVFVSVAEQDGTPATLRALYVMKAAQAEVVLAGGAAPMIEREAELRGYTPYQMARIIVQMAADSSALEIERMGANVEIETAENEDAIVATLAKLGIELVDESDRFGAAGYRLTSDSQAAPLPAV